MVPAPKAKGAMDPAGMDGPPRKPDAPGAPAADPTRVQAQTLFMKARRLGEDAAKLRAAGAAAERTTLVALRSRFDRLAKGLRDLGAGLKGAPQGTQALVRKVRQQMAAADTALIDTRLSLDLQRAKQRQKKKPAPAEDF